MKILIFLLLFSDCVQAQFVNINSPVNAALSTTSALLAVSTRKNTVHKDMITGTCNLNGSGCAGAEIVLFKNGLSFTNTKI